MSAFTYKVIKPFDCFATDGKVKPTNSYYGASQIFRPDYHPTHVPAGTLIHDMAGGRWLEIDGKLMGFCLDKRHPNDVGSFEKHYDPTPHIWLAMFKDGSVVSCGETNMDTFMSMYREYQRKG